MKFEPVNLKDAEGHILAHTAAIENGTVKKGVVLTSDDISALGAAGYERVTVAILGADDVSESDAARTLGSQFIDKGIGMTDPVAGRINLIAETDGLLQINEAVINAFNTVDETITIATLPDCMKVSSGTLLATLKIIPYGVAREYVDRAINCLNETPISILPFMPSTCDIILTRTPILKTSLLEKSRRAIEARVASLNLHVREVSVVEHEQHAVAEALNSSKSGLVLVLGASATSDRRDVIPASIDDIGGHVERFGMPVDPGNLLVLGRHEEKMIVGLPGCARSPALNGADWVLQRIAAGMSINSADIAAMGVGGLLKETPERIQPRMLPAKSGQGITAILLAAGTSRRMRGEDKLLRLVGDVPLIRHSAQTLLSSNIADCVVVLRPGADHHRSALDGLPVRIVEAPDAEAGMSASLRTGILSLEHDPQGILVALADMPDLTPGHIDQVISAHDRTANRLIITPTTPVGSRGHPVLFDARFLETLAGIQGDMGARNLIQSVPEFVHSIKMDEAVGVDLDTPEAWDDWSNSS